MAADVTRLSRGGDCKEEKGCMSSLEGEDGDSVDDSLVSTRSGKPPRNLSVIRHCSSSAWLNELVGAISSCRGIDTTARCLMEFLDENVVLCLL